MKKKLFVGVLILTVACLFSQAQLTMDIPHIIETVRNGYQMYEQVQTMIKQLEYQYESTKAQLKSIQQLDPSDISSFRDAVKYVDKNLTFLRNTENNLRNIRISMGNNSYSLFDLYKAPGGVWDKMTDLWTREMTQSEKERAWAYYGLDPRNYRYTQVWKNRITDTAQKLASISEQTQQMYEESEEQNEKIADAISNTESVVGQSQITNELILELKQILALLSVNLSLTGEQISDLLVSEMNYSPSLSVSDDFLKKSTMPDLQFRGLE